MDGQHYPMEMQLVFYHGDLTSMSEVTTTEAEDSLVAISFFFQVFLAYAIKCIYANKIP